MAVKYDSIRGRRTMAVRCIEGDWRSRRALHDDGQVDGAPCPRCGAGIEVGEPDYSYGRNVLRWYAFHDQDR